MNRPKPDIYCDVDRCKNGARWRVDALDESGDYQHTCNSHLGKVCERIVKTSKVKYDIVYLPPPKPKSKTRKKGASVKVVGELAAETVSADPPKRRRRRKTATRKNKKKGPAKPRTRKKRW